MPDTAVSIVADTLRTHLLTPFGRCTCGAGDGIWEIDDEAPWADHVAAAVVDALGGLEREWGSQMLGDDEITIGSEGTARFCAQQHPLTWTALSRWVSGWVREPAEENRDA